MSNMNNKRRGRGGGGGGPRNRGRPVPNIDRSVLNEGVYQNPRLMHCVTSLLGSNVEVHMKNGQKYEGVLTTVSYKMKLILEVAHKVEGQNTTPTQDTLISKMFIKWTDVVSVKALSVDLESVQKGSVEKDAFTDSAISSKMSINGQGPERELQPWDATGQDCKLEELEESTPAAATTTNGGSTNGWDVNEMFKTNCEKFDVKSTYDPNLAIYTTPLDRKNTAEYRALEAKAARIADEIERSDAYKQSIALENGDGDDEEMAFSAVVRDESPPVQSGAPGKYIPPHLRKAGSSVRGPGPGRPAQQNNNKYSQPPPSQQTQGNRVESSVTTTVSSGEPSAVPTQPPSQAPPSEQDKQMSVEQMQEGSVDPTDPNKTHDNKNEPKKFSPKEQKELEQLRQFSAQFKLEQKMPSMNVGGSMQPSIQSSVQNTVNTSAINNQSSPKPQISSQSSLSSSSSHRPQGGMPPSSAHTTASPVEKHPPSPHPQPVEVSANIDQEPVNTPRGVVVSSNNTVGGPSGEPVPTASDDKEKEENEPSIVKTSKLNPFAKEFKMPTTPVQKQPAATPPRPQTQSPQAAPVMPQIAPFQQPQTMFPAGAYVVPGGAPTIQQKPAIKKATVSVIQQPDLAAAQATGQPLLQSYPQSFYMPAYQNVQQFNGQRMMQMGGNPRMMAVATSQSYDPNSQYTQQTPQQPIYQIQAGAANSGNMGHISHGAVSQHGAGNPAHLQPHLQTTQQSQNSNPQQTSHQVPPAPSPIQQQPPHSSGTPQPPPPYMPYNQSPLQPTTPASPQNMYPPNMYAYTSQQGGAGLISMQPASQVQPQSASNTTHVTHAQHHQHSHTPQTQNIVMIPQASAGGQQMAAAAAQLQQQGATQGGQPTGGTAISHHFTHHLQQGNRLQGAVANQGGGMMPQQPMNMPSTMHPVQFIPQAQLQVQQGHHAAIPAAYAHNQ